MVARSSTRTKTSRAPIACGDLTRSRTLGAVLSASTPPAGARGPEAPGGTGGEGSGHEPPAAATRRTSPALIAT